MSAAPLAAHDAQPPAGRAGTIQLGGRVTVNRMGFGAMRLPGVHGAAAPQGATRLVRRAIDLGVNFIDTAHAYGPETSERLIAEALDPYPAGLIVATKSGYGRGLSGEWLADGHPTTIRRQAERSLQLLRVERIDLLQLHVVDPAVPIEESVGAIVELASAGKVNLIGVSNVSVGELERARAVAEIATVQNRYSLADRGSEDVLTYCERAGIAFLPWHPLAAGTLARTVELREIAAAHDATPAQVALAWLLQHSPVMLPIPGTGSVDHLEENVAAAGLRLSAEELARIARMA